MKQITLPDGRTLELPDEATHEQIVRAIRHASASSPPPPPEKKKAPMSGWNPLDEGALSPVDPDGNFMAGLGKAAADTALGLSQMAVGATAHNPKVPKQAQARALENYKKLLEYNTERQDRDVHLMATPSGFLGNLTGNLIPAVIPGVGQAGKAPAGASLLAKALGYAEAAGAGGLWAQTIPTSSDAERAENTVMGMVAAPALKAVPTVIGTTGDILKEGWRRATRELPREAIERYKTAGLGATEAIDNVRDLLNKRYQDLRTSFNSRYTANEANPNLVGVHLPNTKAGIASVPDSMAAQLMLNPKVKSVMGAVGKATDVPPIITPSGQIVPQPPRAVPYSDVTQSLKEINKLLRNTSKDDPGFTALNNFKTSLEADLAHWGATGGDQFGKMPASEVAANKLLNQASLAERAGIQSDYGATLGKFYDRAHPLNKIAKPKFGELNPQMMAEGRLLGAESGPELNMIDAIVPGFKDSMRGLMGTRLNRIVESPRLAAQVDKLPDALYSKPEQEHLRRISDSLRKEYDPSISTSDFFRAAFVPKIEAAVAGVKGLGMLPPVKRAYMGVEKLGYQPTPPRSYSMSPYLSAILAGQ